VHASALPPPPAPPVRARVLLQPPASSFAARTSKDAAWVAQREALLRRPPRPAGHSNDAVDAGDGDGYGEGEGEGDGESKEEEVLLADPATGEVLEGLSSNFFAVVGGAVHTAPAPEQVLGGTVRAAALAACAAEGVPVIGAAPRLRDAWEGAFLTSTSRLVLPLDAVAGSRLTWTARGRDVVRRLALRVRAVELPQLSSRLLP